MIEDQTEPKLKYQPQLKLVKAFYANSKEINDCKLIIMKICLLHMASKIGNVNYGIYLLEKLLCYQTKFIAQLLTIHSVIILQLSLTVSKNFDLATRKCQVLDGYQKLVNCISFHPNSQFIATESPDQTARLRNGCTGKQVQIFNGHNKTIKSLNFNSNGDRLVTFSYDKTARIWDVESGNCIKILGGSEFIVERIQFDNAGDYCVIITMRNNYHRSQHKYARACIIWSLKSGQCIKTFAAYSNIEWLCFNFSRNRIVTVFNDHTCKVYDVQTGKYISELINENGVMRGHYFGQKNQIITTSFFAPARIYSEAGECLQKLGSYKNEITNYSLSQKGTMFISAFHNGLCKIWKNLNN